MNDVCHAKQPFTHKQRCLDVLSQNVGKYLT